MPNLRRAALLMAFTYDTSPFPASETGLAPLTAPRYDLPRVEKFLRSKGITDITILTDTTGNWQSALRENIHGTLARFLKRTVNERLDYAFIYYAGHGAQTASKLSDEANEIVNPDARPPRYIGGLDEALVPLDANVAGNRNGPLLDNTLHNLLATAYGPCHITMLMDCCHSGTICDLRCEYKTPENLFVNQKEREITGHTIISFGGSMDQQLSYESSPDSIFNSTNGIVNADNPTAPGGYFTCALIDLLTKRWELNKSCLKLFGACLQKMKEVSAAIPGGLPQIPQLNTNRRLTDQVAFILE
jgi:hypothetical protein